MSRIMILNVGKPSFQSTVEKEDPDVNLALVSTLDGLGAQNAAIKSALETLAQSKIKLVRESAEKVFPAMQGRPEWPSF